MNNSIILYNYFKEQNEQLLIFVHIIKNKKDFEILKNGYTPFLNGESYFIGQIIKAEFVDTFTISEIEMLIIDILIEEKENFGLLLVPINKNNFFSENFNPLLKTILDIENTRVPKDACFFAKHIGRGRFVFEVEEKSNMRYGAQINVTIPKLFSIPVQTKKRLLIFKKLKKSTILKIDEKVNFLLGKL